jgi:hypothetical protein
MVAPARAPLRTDRLRTLNAPRLVTVELHADGSPAKVWRLAVEEQLRRSDGQETTAAVVETILEMWRIDDEWWRQLISRCYFSVLLEGGAHVVLFEDLVTHEWFMQTA